MVKLAANLSFLFTEYAFLDRFSAAAEAGFEAVEYMFAFDTPPSAIAGRLREHDLDLVLINTPPGDLAAGELGLAVLADRRPELRAAFDWALGYAVELDVPRIHFLAGNPPPEVDPAETEAIFLENIVYAADLAGRYDRIITLEPLNSRDRPEYFLKSNAMARRLITQSARSNVQLQLDLYHCQISGEDIGRTIEENLPITGHIQIAGVPDRAEPDGGALAIFRQLDALGYRGHVGCEYVPRGDTRKGLDWARPYLRKRASD